eukprot:6191729-Pleurochrysis_carterae.AAC.1
MTRARAPSVASTCSDSAPRSAATTVSQACLCEDRRLCECKQALLYSLRRCVHACACMYIA